jgi:hypothetical protein
MTTALNADIRELTMDEVDRVDGGLILDFGLFRVAGMIYDGGVALGVEVLGERFIVNICPGCPK